MAAGLGFKEFTTGDVLTAADANGYLASQVVMVFADAAARTSAIASPEEGMISFLKDTNSTEYYSGAAWVAISGGATGGLTLISTTTLSTGTTTINATLTSYQNVFMLLKMVSASTGTELKMRINGDTGSNYNTNVVLGTGSTSSGRSSINATSHLIAPISTGSTVRAAVNGSINLYRVNDTNEIVMDYTTRNDNGVDYRTDRGCGAYDGSAIVSSVTFFLDSGTFTGGTVYLYGVN
jgi:hypothetical protein